MKAFFKARGEIHSSGDPTLQKSFADTLIGMLNNIKCFGTAEATQIIDALRGEPYGEDQTKRIMAIVDIKVAKGSGPVKPECSGKQSLKEWWCYLTRSDWDVLQNPKLSVNRKMTTMVERAMAVGCNDPDQHAFRWGTALLAVTHYETPPEPRKLWDLLKDFKACFKSEKKDFGFSRILEYPASPSELPTDIFQSAYPGDDQPITIELKGINTVADNISLRSSNAKLKSPLDLDAKAKFKEAKDELGIAHSHDTTPAPTAHESNASPAGALIPSPTDPYEMGLFYDYQHKLLEYRKEKSKAAAWGPEAPPRESRATSQLGCPPSS